VQAAWWLQPAALSLGFILLVEVVYIVFAHRETFPSIANIGEDFGSPMAVGELLFNQYLLPFEVISVLLLAAMIGAIVLSRPKT
jgi:NADH-quinone oxidoreductase subunit J